MNKVKLFSPSQGLFLTLALILTLSLPLNRVSVGAEGENVQHYKMLSTIEYAGQSQFRNQVEGLLTVQKQFLSDDRVQYTISSSDFDLTESNLRSDQQPAQGGLSFIIDKKTKFLTTGNKDLELLEKINNQCAGSLKTVTKKNIGKTWKQTFKMPFLNHLLPGQINLTLTAIQLRTKVFGEIIAVRALSEPFTVKAASTKGSKEDIKGRINAVYLFDAQMEDIYVSISVFEAETSANRTKERLRHEVATYKTDAMGVSVDLTGLGTEFEKFVRKLGLTKDPLKVTKEAPLPQWAQNEGLSTAQIANICAATACEGAPNPVATIYVPLARTLAMQSQGRLISTGRIGTISGGLANRVIGVSGMRIAAAPLIMGLSPATAAIAGGGAAGVAIAAGGGGGGGDNRSPSVP